MIQKAAIVVGPLHIEFQPLQEMLAAMAVRAESILLARRMTSNAQLGALARQALESYSRGVAGGVRATVDQLFIPRVRGAAGPTPPAQPARGLMLWIERQGAIYRLKPFATAGSAWAPLSERAMFLDAEADDATLGRAIRRAIGIARRATIIRRVMLAPLPVLRWAERAIRRYAGRR